MTFPFGSALQEGTLRGIGVSQLHFTFTWNVVGSFWGLWFITMSAAFVHWNCNQEKLLDDILWWAKQTLAFYPGDQIEQRYTNMAILLCNDTTDATAVSRAFSMPVSSHPPAQLVLPPWPCGNHAQICKKITTPDDTESHRGNTTLEIIEFAPSSCTLNQLRLWSFIVIFVLLEATNIQKGFILGDWITFHSCLAGDWRGCARAS